MNTAQILKESRIDHIVKNICVLEEKNHSGKTILPFFADGFPGIMYYQNQKKAVLNPTGKKLSNLVLYGLTIKPIEIALEGPYLLIVFQLYPFASKLLFDIDPRTLNDDCYDLLQLENINIREIDDAQNINDQLLNIARLIDSLAKKILNTEEQQIQLAINIILNSKGNITVKSLTRQLRITERTLQRRFLEYVGISPKQFMNIIQFDSSISQISEEALTTLTAIVYDNGYADQSHFIRSIKKYSGKKPSEFKKVI